MTAADTDDWNELARAKLAKAVGDEEAATLMVRVLASLRLDALESADDLYDFAQALSGLGGEASSVGALLSLTAVLRGASLHR